MGAVVARPRLASRAPNWTSDAAALRALIDREPLVAVAGVSFTAAVIGTTTRSSKPRFAVALGGSCRSGLSRGGSRDPGRLCGRYRRHIGNNLT